MYLGKIVETGPGREVFSHPAHPYTKALISAVPIADPSKPNDPNAIPSGEVPSAVNLPQGCRFASRCPFAEDKCRQTEPELKLIASAGQDGKGLTEHLAACFYAAGEL